MLNKIELNKRYIGLFFIIGLLAYGSLNTVKFFTDKEKGTPDATVQSTETNQGIEELLVFEDTPDFAAFKDVKQKKSAFFDFIYPMVVNTNIKILEERSFIEASTSLSKDEQALCKKYRLDCSEDKYKEQFLSKVNVIPASLALAQAANESSWGTSRFAKQANNYFGEWCFTKGCGIVPRQRDANKDHEVEKFESVFYSVNSYIHNLNSHPAYQDLRNLRSEGEFSGLVLSKGLLKYSERGHEYVEEINSMISFNKLTEYDTKMFEYLNLSNDI